MNDCTHQRAIDCAGRGANRAAAILHHDLERGVGSLKAIACIAPLLGAFGTAIGVIRAVALFYRMSALERGETAGSPAEAFVLIAVSLPVAVLACGGSHYLIHQLATFDVEMRVATLELLNNLARFHRGPRG